MTRGTGEQGTKRGRGEGKEPHPNLGDGGDEIRVDERTTLRASTRGGPGGTGNAGEAGGEGGAGAIGVGGASGMGTNPGGEGGLGGITAGGRRIGQSSASHSADADQTSGATHLSARERAGDGSGHDGRPGGADVTGAVGIESALGRDRADGRDLPTEMGTNRPRPAGGTDGGASAANASGIVTMREAFLADLAELYAAERAFAVGLAEMFQVAQDPRIKQTLQQHVADTQQQMENLDRAFAVLGADPVDVPCRSADGLVDDMRAKTRHIDEPHLRDNCIVAGNLKAEHLEIAAYRPLAEKAGMMGMVEVERLLRQNLAMEECFARILEQLGRQLGRQLMAEHPELVGAA
jgi:ferritin-like metal-binding protein YciE